MRHTLEDIVWWNNNNIILSQHIIIIIILSSCAPSVRHTVFLKCYTFYKNHVRMALALFSLLRYFFYLLYGICNFLTAAFVFTIGLPPIFCTHSSRNASETVCKPDAQEMRSNNIINVHGRYCFPNVSLAVHCSAVYYEGR